MDYRFHRSLDPLRRHPLSDGLFTFLANDLALVLMAIVALVFLVLRAGAACRSGAVLATASAGLALLINQPIAHLVDRARPYVAYPAQVHLLVARSPDPSFPSDHATGTFALAFGIWLYDRTIGTVLLALAALLALARVDVGAHYPGDVLAGAVVGIAVAGALYVLPTRRLVEAIASVALPRATAPAHSSVSVRSRRETTEKEAA